MLKLRIKATTEAGWKRIQEVRWAQLKKCTPFIRGYVRIVEREESKSKSYSLSYRDQDTVRHCYFPRRFRGRLEACTENYVKAKQLLDAISYCELQILRLAADKEPRQKN